MLNLENISYHYPNQQLPIIDNISFSAQKGECVAILGANGIGKSTLLRIISGFIFPQSGTYRFNGTLLNLTPVSAASFRRKYIGFMPQKELLIDEKTAKENVLLSLMRRQISKAEALSRTVEMFSEMDIPYLLDRYPSDMSGGEKQLVSFIRSSISLPSLLILDEPSTHLDSQSISKIQKYILRMQRSQSTILIATHDEEMLSICSSSYLLAPQ